MASPNRTAIVVSTLLMALALSGAAGAQRNQKAKPKPKPQIARRAEPLNVSLTLNAVRKGRADAVVGKSYSAEATLLETEATDSGIRHYLQINQNVDEGLYPGLSQLGAFSRFVVELPRASQLYAAWVALQPGERFRMTARLVSAEHLVADFDETRYYAGIPYRETVQRAYQVWRFVPLESPRITYSMAQIKRDERMAEVNQALSELVAAASKTNAPRVRELLDLAKPTAAHQPILSNALYAAALAALEEIELVQFNIGKLKQGIKPRPPYKQRYASSTGLGLQEDIEQVNRNSEVYFEWQRTDQKIADANREIDQQCENERTYIATVREAFGQIAGRLLACGANLKADAPISLRARSTSRTREAWDTERAKISVLDLLVRAGDKKMLESLVESITSKSDYLKAFGTRASARLRELANTDPVARDRWFSSDLTVWADSLERRGN